MRLVRDRDGRDAQRGRVGGGHRRARARTQGPHEGVLMISVAVVGLGKMGLSHLSIVRANPEVEVVGVCDSSAYILSVLEKYTGVRTFSEYDQLLEATRPDAVIIATPSRSHGALVRTALERD